MAIQIQLRQGTTTEHNTFKGAVGEVTVDTTKDVPVVHDGVTVGGHPVASKANADGTISLIKKDGTSAGIINSTGLFNNTLTSTNTNQALTAAQGKVLKDSLDTTITSSFGIGQTWQDVKSLRASGVVYTNTTGKPITVSFSGNKTSGSSSAVVVVGGVTILDQLQDGDGACNNGLSFNVPNNTTYSITYSGILVWSELR